MEGPALHYFMEADDYFMEADVFFLGSLLWTLGSSLWPSFVFFSALPSSTLHIEG
jgi:hypothetical protein